MNRKIGTALVLVASVVVTLLAANIGSTDDFDCIDTGPSLLDREVRGVVDQQNSLRYVIGRAAAGQRPTDDRDVITAVHIK